MGIGPGIFINQWVVRISSLRDWERERLVVYFCKDEELMT